MLVRILLPIAAAVGRVLTVPRSLLCCSPKGTYSNEVGASECEPCAAGQYSNADGGRTCKVSQPAMGRVQQLAAGAPALPSGKFICCALSCLSPRSMLLRPARRPAPPAPTPAVAPPPASSATPASTR